MSPIRPSLRERVAMKPLRDVYQGSDDLWAYRAAAATLASFDLESLVPFQGGPYSDLRAQLLVECDALSFENGRTRWSLRTPVRQTTLLRLYETGLLAAALAANPQRDLSPTQTMFERCIDLSSPSPGLPTTLDDAAALLEVSYWLQVVPALWSRLPSRDSIREVIAQQQLVEPFRSLVGDHFAGRVAELATLSDYVGALPASTVGESFSRVFEQVFNIKERPPLFVVGPGGSGKSTLIGKFVLDHVDRFSVARFPFAYLDFDRKALRPERPVTLLLDIMRQLAIQYPATAPGYKETLEQWTSSMSLSPEVDAEAAKDLSDGTSSDSADQSTTDIYDAGESEPDVVATSGSNVFSVLETGFDHKLDSIQQFGAFVQSLQPHAMDTPLLLVLDTFEEVQFQSSASEDDVFDLLAQLQQGVPRLRTVICGRTEIVSTNYKVRKLELGNFDEPAALAFLAHQGISDLNLASTIYKQVGGSPLVLRLAADVATKEGVGEEGIQRLGSRWLDMFRSESVEVVLYKRILSHVYDERVQRLAHPGLVLRFITPEVLLEVLSPACGVAISGIVDARGLVKVMRQQLTTMLVPFGADEQLAHRPDMRSILLFDLTSRAKKDKELALKLQQTHLKAVGFYAKFDSVESRAEELYHRLSLGEDREVIKDRWRDDAGVYLGSAILELPVDAQIFVAARTGFDIPQDLWNEAIEEDWVLLATRRVSELVRLNKPDEASELLRKHLQSKKIPGPGQGYRDMGETVLSGFARSYEEIRRTMDSGNDRTKLMDELVAQVRNTARTLVLDSSTATRFFSKATAGDRVVGLAVAQGNPRPELRPMMLEAISNARSPFEQYHGLVLADSFKDFTIEGQTQLRQALLYPKGTPIHQSDPSRTRLRDSLLRKWTKTLS